MPELPLDLRRGAIQAQATPRARTDTSFAQGLQAIGKGITDLGKVAGAKFKKEQAADQDLRLKEYVNGQRLLTEEAAQVARDTSDADGNNAVSIFNDLNGKIPSQRPEGMTKLTFKRALVALKGTEGSMQSGLQAFSVGQRKEAAGKRVEKVDAQNWDSVKRFKSKLILTDYINSLKSVAEDGFTAMGIGESQRDVWVNKRISERKSEFVEMYGTQSIKNAEEMQKSLADGFLTDFDGRKVPLTGDAADRISGDDRGALRTILQTYIQKEGLRIISSEQESFRASESLIGHGIKPNINLEALEERLKASLPEAWTDVVSSLLAQANALNIRGEIAFGSRGLSDLDLQARLSANEKRLSNANSLSPQDKKRVQEQVANDNAAIKAIRKRRADNPHQGTLDADLSGVLQSQYNAIQQMTIRQESLDPNSQLHKEIQKEKIRLGNKYASGMFQVGTYALGDVDEVRLEGPEQTKAFLAAFDQYTTAGNSDSMTALFKEKSDLYGPRAAAMLIQAAFGDRGIEVNLLASMSQTNPVAFKSAITGTARFADNKKDLGDATMKLIKKQLLGTTLSVLQQAYPDKNENVAFTTYKNLIEKMTASNLNSGRADNVADAADMAYASMFADKDFIYNPVDRFDFFTEEQSAIMVDRSVARENPWLSHGVDAINKSSNPLRDALKNLTFTDADGATRPWNFFNPGAAMDEEARQNIQDSRFQAFGADDGSGVVITIGKNHEPLIGPDGDILIIPWAILNHMGTDAITFDTRLGIGDAAAPNEAVGEFRKVQTQRWNDFFAQKYSGNN